MIWGNIVCYSLLFEWRNCRFWSWIIVVFCIGCNQAHATVTASFGWMEKPLVHLVMLRQFGVLYQLQHVCHHSGSIRKEGKPAAIYWWCHCNMSIQYHNGHMYRHHHWIWSTAENQQGTIGHVIYIYITTEWPSAEIDITTEWPSAENQQYIMGHRHHHWMAISRESAVYHRS